MSIETPPLPISRLYSVQVLRGLAALSVVFSHLIVMEKKYSPDQISPESFIHGFAGVDLFFVISGFIMVYVTQNTIRGGKSVSEFLFARAGRIYPLYWVVTFALVFVWLYRPDMVFGSSTEPNILKSFLLWPDVSAETGNIAPPLMNLGWTLIHEMSFYLVFAFSLFLPRKFLPAFLAIWTTVFLSGFLWGGADLKNAAQIFFHPLTAEFLLGAFAGLIFLRWKGFGWPVALVSSIVVLAIMVYTLGVDYTRPWTRVATIGVPATLLLFALVGLEKHRKIKFAKPLTLLGDWSYALYLTHILTLSLIGRLWAGFSRDGIADNIIILIAMIATSIVVAAVTYQLIERPLIKKVKRVRKRVFSS